MYLSAYRVRNIVVLLCLVGFLGNAAVAQQQKPAPSRSDTNTQSQGNSASSKPCPKGIGDTWNNCTGSTEFPNGDRYVGNFKNGLPDGIGTYYWKNGRQYVGEVKNARATGKGKFTTRNNVVYQGNFIDGKINGKGTVDYPNGAKYIGELKDFRRAGQGIFTAENGDKFSGEFINDEMAPNGLLEFVNGDIYSGEIQAMKPNGKGTYTFKDGRKLNGIFVAGEPKGQGRLVAADGAQIASGEFSGWDNLNKSPESKPVEQAVAPQQSAQVLDPNDVFIVTRQSPSESQDTAPPEPAAAQDEQKTQTAEPEPIPAAPATVAPQQNMPVATSMPSDGSAPVICRFRNGFWYDTVQCDVISDRVEIREITFNRGQCPSATAGFDTLQSMKQKDGGNITLLFRAMFLNIKDFRKPKKFGERIEIPVLSCNNLLEYTVEANNTVQTWKTY